MGYEVIDVDFAIHVPIDNLRYIGSTLTPPKVPFHTLPEPAERTGGYFGPRRRRQ